MTGPQAGKFARSDEAAEFSFFFEHGGEVADRSEAHAKQFAHFVGGGFNLFRSGLSGIHYVRFRHLSDIDVIFGR